MSPEISYLYSIPYIIIILLLLLLFFKGNEYLNDEKRFLNIRIATISLLLLFIGLRGHVYSDWSSYYPFFEDLPTIWSGDILNEFKTASMEPGFIIYSVLIKSFFPNYFIWVFINTAIDIWVLDKIFKKYTKYYVLAFIVFFVMNGLMVEFNLYRNAKAIILFILSLEYLKNRKFIPYFLINLLGFTFHYSALLFLPLYFILDREIPRSIVYLIFIVSNIVFIFHLKWINLVLGDIVSLLNVSLISEKTLGYADSASEVVFSLGYFERVISFLVFTILYKRLVALNSINRIFYNVFLFYLIFIFCFSEVMVFSERFSYLFCFAYWFLYPNVYTLISSKMNKSIFLSIFILFLFLRLAAGNKNLLSKYDNLLFGIENYDDRSLEFEQYSRFLN